MCTRSFYASSVQQHINCITQWCSGERPSSRSSSQLKAFKQMRSCEVGALFSVHRVDATLTGVGCLLFNSTTSYTWEEANNYCQRDDYGFLVEIGTKASSWISSERSSIFLHLTDVDIGD